MKRRDILKAVPAAAAATIASTLSGPGPLQAAQSAARRGMPPLTITTSKSSQPPHPTPTGPSSR